MSHVTWQFYNVSRSFNWFGKFSGEFWWFFSRRFWANFGQCSIEFRCKPFFISTVASFLLYLYFEIEQRNPLSVEFFLKFWYKSIGPKAGPKRSSGTLWVKSSIEIDLMVGSGRKWQKTPLDEIVQKRTQLLKKWKSREIIKMTKTWTRKLENLVQKSISYPVEVKSRKKDDSPTLHLGSCFIFIDF